MIRLSRHSERFAASGGIGARTTRRALGAHTLGFWELFLRETLQNSWDARQSEAGPIKFSVDAWNATLGQRAYLRDYLLVDPPPLLGLDVALEDPGLTLLAVSDTGTWGLSGPTRADLDPSSFPGGRTDFVDLVATRAGGLTKAMRAALMASAKQSSAKLAPSQLSLSIPGQ